MNTAFQAHVVILAGDSKVATALAASMNQAVLVSSSSDSTQSALVPPSLMVVPKVEADCQALRNVRRAVLGPKRARWA
jgi:hypothetical protein